MVKENWKQVIDGSLQEAEEATTEGNKDRVPMTS